MTLALLLLGLACFGLAFWASRVVTWARLGGSDTPPPRDVRLFLRIFARDLMPEIDELWPR
jgi:hypothetical protein